MLSQSEIIKRAIERVADAEIEKKTAPCFRTYKAIVTEAPNGTTCKVRLVGDETILTLPYASKLSGITVGKFVWVGAFYNVDNSFSNAIVWETLKMDVSGGGGSTVTVDDTLSTTSTNPVQNAVITRNMNALPHDGIYYLTNNGSIAADTTTPYYASRWITTNDNVTSYFDGMTVALKVPVAGNGTYGTVLSINGLGEHPVIRNVSTMVGTTYGVGCMLVLTYDANASGSAYINSSSATSIQGVWKVSDYDSTIVYRLEQYYTTPAVNANAGALYRYEICFSKFDGSLVPANNQSNKETTYTKALNDEPFDPFGNIYYYLSTTTVAAGADVAANTLYRVYLADSRYSFNINSSGTEGTTALSVHEPVYVKALYNKTTKTATLTQDLTSANYLERSGLVQSLPTTNPNTGLAANQMYIYIYLGHAYSKYQVDLAAIHQVYAWDDEAQATVIYHGEDSNAFHKTDIIPLENGGTGLDGGTGLNWYNSTTLHPRFVITYDVTDNRFRVNWFGSLDGINSVSAFFASDQFKYAQRTTHTLNLMSASGTYLGSAMLFTGAFDANQDTQRLYFLFPDVISFGGNYVNGLSGTLAYDAVNGIYMDPTSMVPSVPEWVTLLAGKEDTSNKVTSISSSSTDDQYPSAKLLYDTEQTLSGLIQDVDEESEKIANKVTSISSSSTNTQYPSAKAVYDAIQGNDPIEDTDVFLSRTASFGENKYKSAKLVGGTVAFNQIAVAPSNRTGYGITITRDSEKKTTTVSGTATRVFYVQFDESPLPIVGHVYYASLGNASIPNNTIILYNDNAGVNTGYGQNGETIGKATGAKKFHYRIDATASFSSPVTLTPQIIDLTLMFGSAIADRIYALERATTGVGVAWFRKYFPKDYYPYNTGTLVSVCPTGMASGDASYKVSPLELNGFPSIDSNDNLVYDGDIRESNGTVTRKYRKIRVTSFDGAFGATSNGYAVYKNSFGIERTTYNFHCDRFSANYNAYSTMPVMTWIGGSGAAVTFTFVLPSTVTSLAEANTWLASNPTNVMIPVVSEFTESTYPFKSPQIVYSDETESFIDDRDVPVPVGQIAEYMGEADAVEAAALADTSNYEYFEKTDTMFAYTASGLAFSNSALTIPIDGTKYKILQMTVFNKDLSVGFGFPRLFIFDASGSTGYIEGTSTYCTTTSAASGITATFDSSWDVTASTNVDIVVLYRRIS